MRRGKALAFVAIDVLGTLVAALIVQMNPPPVPSHRAIDTLGQYALVITWPKGDDDVDLYVRDPAGQIVYFANPDAGLMHLEHDDLGDYNDREGAVHVVGNGERVVLRGVLPGEYVVNVHAYGITKPVPVKVELYRLAGGDRRLRAGSVSLPATGAERTAFRFTLGPGGMVRGYSTLPRQMVDRANGIG
jgi:hypothetical protein